MDCEGKVAVNGVQGVMVKVLAIRVLPVAGALGVLMQTRNKYEVSGVVVPSGGLLGEGKGKALRVTEGRPLLLFCGRSNSNSSSEQLCGQAPLPATVGGLSG